ncbi:MAG: riboflavin biosynthesis protein RibF [Chloroflexi bacterium 44-23]|nr:MAG: riboflavin biosynthesis protein RibF [Chloroflexi bacterium 44-23]
MKHLRELTSLPTTGLYAAIGTFDGVHTGHQQLIQAMVNQAQKTSTECAVITFFPIPAIVIRNIQTPITLTSPEEKAALFEKLGLNYTITLQFTKEMAQLTPTEFIDLLVSNLPIKQIWVGEDFTFGHQRRGNTTVLSQLGMQYGFETIIVKHFLQNSEKISSSQIRNWLTSGDLESANKALGRPYSITGVVKHGDQRGSKIGFPTANLAVWEGKLLPASGVYATFAQVEGKIYTSVTNIGFRPTFVDNEPNAQVECYIHNFDRNIYDLPVQLFLVSRIRAEKRFESISALIQQIKNDAAKSEEILKHAEFQTGLLTGSTKTAP